MEQNQQSPGSSSLFQLNLDAQNSYSLRGASSWSKVMGVVGIILGLLFVVFAVIALNQINNAYSYRYRSGNSLAEMFSGRGKESAQLGIIIFIVTGIIFILGGIFSYNFGNKISAALRSNDQHSLSRGFSALRNYYALRAIVLIIVLLLLLLSLAGSL